MRFHAIGTYSDKSFYDTNDGGLHGSMTRMPHLAALEWDYADRLKHTVKSDGSGQDTYFTYDAAGQRVRKVYHHDGLIEERIYLGPFEIYRKRINGNLDLERESFLSLLGTKKSRDRIQFMLKEGKPLRN